MQSLSRGNVVLADRSIGVLKDGENYYGFASVDLAAEFVTNDKRCDFYLLRKAKK